MGGMLHLLRAQLRRPTLPGPRSCGGAEVQGRERCRCQLLRAVTGCRLWLLVPLRAFNWSSRSDGWIPRQGDSTAQQGQESVACTTRGIPSGLGALEDPLLAWIPKLAVPLFCQFVVISRKTSTDRGLTCIYFTNVSERLRDSSKGIRIL